MHFKRCRAYQGLRLRFNFAFRVGARGAQVSILSVVSLRNFRTGPTTLLLLSDEAPPHFVKRTVVWRSGCVGQEPLCNTNRILSMRLTEHKVGTRNFLGFCIKPPPMFFP